MTHKIFRLSSCFLLIGLLFVTMGFQVEGSQVAALDSSVAITGSIDLLEDAPETMVVQDGEKRQLTEQLLSITSKSIYFLGLFLMIGWALLWQIVRTYSFELRKKYVLYGRFFQILHLLGILAILFIYLEASSFYEILNKLVLLIGSNIGKLLFASLLISIIGIIFLFKNQLFNYFWVILIGIIKSISGYIDEMNSANYILVGLNIIQLFVISFWAAGIVFILLFWRKQKLYIKYFLRFFNKAAFLSILLLIILCSGRVYLLSPNIDFIGTTWGIALLVNAFVIIILLFLRAVIWKRRKKGKVVADLITIFKLEFMLILILTIFIASFATLNSQSNLPSIILMI